MSKILPAAKLNINNILNQKCVTEYHNAFNCRRVKGPYLQCSASKPLFNSKSLISPKRSNQNLMSQATGHDAPASAQNREVEEWKSFLNEQKALPRLKPEEAAKTLIENTTACVISTISTKSEIEGFPFSSSIDYAADSKGRLIFSVSSLAAHTSNMLKDPRITAYIPENKTIDISDQIVTLTGRVRVVSEEEKEEVSKEYLKKKPDAYWIGWGDFSFFRLDEILAINYRYGVLTPLPIVTNINVNDYNAAVPDQLYNVFPKILDKYNERLEDLNAINQYYLEGRMDKLKLIRADKLGIDVKCQSSKYVRMGMTCRIPYEKQIGSEEELEREMEKIVNKATAKI